MKVKGVQEFPLEHALAIAIGMCAGLVFAHEKRDLDGSALNIVHRDISPQNVVVTFSGDVKIVDFGIAKSDVRLARRNEQRTTQRQSPVHVARAGARRDGRLRGATFSRPASCSSSSRRENVLFKGVERVRDAEVDLRPRVSDAVADARGLPGGARGIVMRALAKDATSLPERARDAAELEDFVRASASR